MRDPASRPSQHALALVEQALLGLVALALVALLSMPAARSVSGTFGWLPFWLTALPLCAWATARALRLSAPRAPTRPLARVLVLASVRPRMRTRPAQALSRAA